MELNHYNLTKENAEPVSPSKIEFNSALENTLFDGKASSKILSFKDKAPVPKSHHQNSLHALYSDDSVAAPKKAHRFIPTTSDRVLDAPGMKDDYYLNLLDWGSNSIFIPYF